MANTKATGKNTPEEETPMFRALASDVLVVAVKGAVGDWAAYIGACAGINHREEAKRIAKNGTKIAPMLACLLFPSMKHLKWRQ